MNLIRIPASSAPSAPSALSASPVSPAIAKKWHHSNNRGKYFPSHPQTNCQSDMARQFAIAIGINQYRYYPQPLRFAECDAAAMAAYFQELGFDTVTRFSDRSPAVNHNPTLPERTNLLLALDAIEQKCLEPEDSVWFFFSGHGASQGNRDYLLPADGNPRLLADTAIPIDRAIRALRRCEAGNLVLILDMCRNEVHSKAVCTQTERLARKDRIVLLRSEYVQQHKIHQLVFSLSVLMTRVEQIQSEIEALPIEDFILLRQWFAEKDWLLWDRQLETDIADGKLDFLLKEAMAAKSEGTLQDL